MTSKRAAYVELDEFEDDSKKAETQTNPEAQDTPLSKQPKRPQWQFKHTFSILVIRLLIDFLFKNLFLFYEDYANDLGVSESDFGYILIFSEVGCIAAILINQTPFMKSLDKSRFIFVFYSIVAGVSSILFACPQLVVADSTHNNDSGVVVLWCGICRFFTGLAFAFLSAESIRYVPCVFFFCFFF